MLTRPTQPRGTDEPETRPETSDVSLLQATSWITRTKSRIKKIIELKMVNVTFPKHRGFENNFGLKWGDRWKNFHTYLYIGKSNKLSSIPVRLSSVIVPSFTLGILQLLLNNSAKVEAKRQISYFPPYELFPTSILLSLRESLSNRKYDSKFTLWI